MGTRLTTSQRTKEIFEELTSKTNLKPFVLSKLAIALSLSNKDSIDKFKEALENYNKGQESNTNLTGGLQLHRPTITAQFDSLFKVLMEDYVDKKLTDDEYFPLHAKLHIDRGAEILRNQYKYSSNLENFINQTLKGDMHV